MTSILYAKIIRSMTFGMRHRT